MELESKPQPVTSDALLTMTSMLECGECFKSFSDPRFLPYCGHTFCLQCLRKLADAPRAPNRRLRCSSCRTPWHVPRDGIEMLPKNVLVADLHAQLHIIRSERDQIVGELAALRQTSEDLFRNLTKSKANENEAQGDSECFKKKTDKLLEANKTKDTEIETLRKDLGRLQSINNKMSLDLAASNKEKLEALQTVERSQVELKECKETINHLTDELDSSRKAAKEKCAEADQLRKRVSTLQSTNDKQSRNLKDVKSQYDLVQTQLNNQQEEAAMVAEQLQTSRRTENEARQKLNEKEIELQKNKMEREQLKIQNANYSTAKEAS